MTTSQMPIRAGWVAPGIDEAPAVSAAQGFRGQGTTDNTDCAAKPWLRLQAELLLAGFPATLIEGDDGGPLLIVSRWAMTKSFDSVPEAEAWLARVKGRE